MKLKILIIDNYDSFTYNLYQYIGELLEERGDSFVLDVFRNDKISLPEILKGKYNRIILSPGPGSPADRSYFGVCADILENLTTVPVLGVCLGMQGIGYYFGGKVVQAPNLMHGKTSVIAHSNKGIFAKVPQQIAVMRYHSLVVEKSSLPSCLEITAMANYTHEIMGLKHKEYPIEGVQFHPESFATEAGKILLENFLQERSFIRSK